MSGYDLNKKPPTSQQFLYDRIRELEADRDRLAAIVERLPSWGEAEQHVAYLQKFPTHRGQRAAASVPESSHCGAGSQASAHEPVDCRDGSGTAAEAAACDCEASGGA